MTQHIFLSPHLDDAVLSCGGLLAQLTQQGQAVRVINIFAGIPPANRPLSAFARYQHRQWQKALASQFSHSSGNNLPQNETKDEGTIETNNPSFVIHHSPFAIRHSSFVQIRHAEDRAALAHFNARASYLNFPDCIYRGEAGRDIWYYTADKDIFGPGHPAEGRLPLEIARVLQAEIETPAEQTLLYAPLGVGNHVDHQLGFLAAVQLAGQGYPLTLYEDYPYAQRHPNDVNRAFQHCSQVLSAPLQPRLSFLSEKHLSVKINAISAYASQLQVLFGGEEAMRQQVTAYARAVGEGQPAERLWCV
jgi:LmbE family N-acetylglucosaminyl deacetylase